MERRVTAFLDPVIDEDVHMLLPEGIPGSGNIAKPQNGLYELKEALRLWYQDTNCFLISQGIIVPGRLDSAYQTEHRQLLQNIPPPLC